MKKETKLWLKQAEEHYKDALYLYKGGRYSACVFFCHQALEKILKACVVEFADKIPSKIHKLDRIAKEAKLDLSKKRTIALAEITRHFWKVRYPDFRRYVYTNKKSAKPTLEKTKEIYLWILNKLNRQ
jgi:HEPN domain-containing protein